MSGTVDAALHLFAVLVEALLPAVGFAGRRAPLVVAQAPRGVGLKPFGGRALVVVERLLTLLAAPGLKNQPQGVHLHAPHRITVDNLRVPVQRFGLRVQLADLRFQVIAEAGIFLDRLGTNVREVDEAAGNRQVRRRGERRYRLARVQQVDQHEIGAGLAVRIDHEGLEVLEIAHAPGSGGPDGIQLGHPAPQLVMFHGRQHRNTLGALISVASCVRSPTLTCSVWYPIGRSAGMVMDAVATNLPSTSYACDPSPAPGSSAPWYSSPFSSVMVAEESA